MDFRIGEDQRELVEGIRAMLAGRLPLEHLRAREGDARAVSDEDWTALGETGVFALTLPEPAGTGLTMAEAVLVFEELGRALVPGPLVGTFLAARGGLVEGAARGGRPGRRALPRDRAPPGRAPGVARRAAGPGGGRCRGDAIAGAGPDGRRRPRRRAARPADPALASRRPPAGGAGGGAAGGRRSFFRDGALLTAALQVGHAAEALDLAVAYAKERQQFGTPIGTFQAVKHMCADMLVRAEVARAAVHAAACLADQPDVVDAEAAATGCTPRELVDRAVGGAKLLADEAAIGNARSAIQVHGGMGFTWEIPLHLHLKRARVRATTFGTPAERAAGLAAYAGASS